MKSSEPTGSFFPSIADLIEVQIYNGIRQATITRGSGFESSRPRIIPNHPGMTGTENSTIRNLRAVFGENDPLRRRDAIGEIFHEDALFGKPLTCNGLCDF